MKIKIDEKEVLALSEMKKKCIQNDIPSEIFDADMERRVCYTLQHKYDQCFKRLKDEWTPRLKASGLESIPLDDEKFAQLVFSQPDYKDRSAREAENKV